MGLIYLTAGLGAEKNKIIKGIRIMVRARFIRAIFFPFIGEYIMELVKYTLCDIELMMVDIDGTLYCSTPQLEKVFCVPRNNLPRLVQNNPGEFSRTTLEDLTSSLGCPKELVDGLGLKRFRKNTRLWSEDDVIGFTWLVRSDIARQCRVQFKEILKQHARRETVSRDMYEQLMRQHAEVINQIPALKEAIEELRENQRAMASHAGASLRLVRETK